MMSVNISYSRINYGNNAGFVRRWNTEAPGYEAIYIKYWFPLGRKLFFCSNEDSS